MSDYIYYADQSSPLRNGVILFFKKAESKTDEFVDHIS